MNRFSFVLTLSLLFSVKSLQASPTSNIELFKLEDCQNFKNPECVRRNEKRIKAFNKAQSERYRSDFLACESGDFKNYHLSGVLIRMTSRKKEKELCVVDVLDFQKGTREICRFSKKNLKFFSAMNKEKPPVDKVKKTYAENCKKGNYSQKYLGHKAQVESYINRYIENRKSLIYLLKVREMKKSIVRLEKDCAQKISNSCSRFERAKKSFERACQQKSFRPFCQ